MSMNRLDRDTILKRALNRADSAVLDAHDRPAGSIVAAAFSLEWLQEGLDYWCKKFPFSSDIVSTPVTLAIGTNTINVPADFVLDYQNGILLDNDAGRLTRKPLSWILNRPQATPGQPLSYSIRGTTLQFWPKADKTYTATLYYYKLPALLASTDIPLFPDDLVLVNYVWLRCQEYHRVAQVGTADAYADKLIKELQISGIGNEAEDDQIQIDRGFASEIGMDPNSWMGKVTG